MVDNIRMPNQHKKTFVTHGEQYRETLKRIKPEVYKKIQGYRNDLNSSKRVCSIDICYDFACNMHCSHCFTTFLQNKEKPLEKFSLKRLKKVCDEADKIGVFAISLQGGEPLFWDDLREIIQTIGPQRFSISIVTNGTLLTLKKAKQIKEMGVDRMCISIDSGIAAEHDHFRNNIGAFKKAISGVRHCLDIDLTPHIHTVVTHQSLYSDGFNSILSYAKKYYLGITVLIAIPAGEWRGKTDILITEEDAKYIQKLHTEYPFLRRDLTPVNGVDTGCRAVTYALYISATGEVLPCPFLHFTLGNVFHERLADILSKGKRIKEFKEYQAKCLAGEDKIFMDKYMTKTFGVNNLPIKVEDVFCLD